VSTSAPAAVRAEHGHGLAGVGREGHVAQDRGGAVARGEVAALDERAHAAALAVRSTVAAASAVSANTAPPSTATTGPGGASAHSAT
jgi:hypothetical protein